MPRSPSNNRDGSGSPVPSVRSLKANPDLVTTSESWPNDLPIAGHTSSETFGANSGHGGAGLAVNGTAVPKKKISVVLQGVRVEEDTI